MSTRLERQINSAWNKYTRAVLYKTTREYAIYFADQLEKNARKIFADYYGDYPDPKLYERTYKFQNQKIERYLRPYGNRHRYVGYEAGIYIPGNLIYKKAGLSGEEIYENVMYHGYHGTKWQSENSTTITSPSPYKQLIAVRDDYVKKLNSGKYSAGISAAFVRAIARTSKSKFNL